MKKKVWFLLIPAVGLLFVTLIGFLGAQWWLFDIFANFRLQYTWIAAVLLVYCWLIKIWRDRKGWVAIGAATIALLVNGWLVSWLFFPLHQSNGPTDFTVLFSNILVYNNQSAQLLAYIKETNPDVVALAEVNERMFNYYTMQLKKNYPYAYHKQKRPFGEAIFSKTQPTNEDIVQMYSQDSLPSLKISLLFKNQPVNVIVTHPYPPTDDWSYHQRNDQLLGMADSVGKSPTRTVVVGDFNMTPWSPIFQHILSRGHLYNSMQDRGEQTSWPTWLPSPMRIPIDHALYTTGLEVVERERGPMTGSDHRPVVIKFKIEQ